MEFTKFKAKYKIGIIIFTFSIVIAIVIVTCFFVGKQDSRMTINELVEGYDKVIDMIKNDHLEVKNNGCVTLPKELEYLSDSGECFIISFGEDTAIYFYTYRGIVDSSKGYVYLAPELSYEDYVNVELYVPTIEFIKTIKITQRLYMCST